MRCNLKGRHSCRNRIFTCRPPLVHSRSNGGEKEEDSSMTSSPPPLKVQVMAGEVESASIFVSIASYRDSECQHTLMNVYKTAMRPQRVFVGLVWQYWEEEDVECFSQALPSPWAKQVYGHTLWLC